MYFALSFLPPAKHLPHPADFTQGLRSYRFAPNRLQDQLPQVRGRLGRPNAAQGVEQRPSCLDHLPHRQIGRAQAIQLFSLPRASLAGEHRVYESFQPFVLQGLTPRCSSSPRSLCRAAYNRDFTLLAGTLRISAISS